MTLSSARRKCPDKKEETSKVSSFFLDKTGDATGNYPDAGIGIISGSVPGLVKKKGRDF